MLPIGLERNLFHGSLFAVKRTVYIETSVVSYYTGRPTRDLVIASRQELTRETWPVLLDAYDCYVSALVEEEAARGDAAEAEKRIAAIQPFAGLDITPDAQVLAARLVSGKAIPEEHPEDGLHVAIAAVNGIEVVLTWNFSHINNPFTRMMLRQVVESHGYRCPEICSPEELLEIGT